MIYDPLPKKDFFGEDFNRQETYYITRRLLFMAPISRDTTLLY